MRINHNIVAMNAHRALASNTLGLQNILEKLSSGFKINKAADDAAGLAISEKLRSQISGLEVSANNAQDGISLIQTAEGALNEVHVMLRRIRELTQMAANGDKTDLDRSHYQHEVDQLLEEIDRISKTTEYNTMKLLDGTVGSTAEEKWDPYDILDSSSVTTDGEVLVSGDYKVEVTRAATKAVAFVDGSETATAAAETDVNAAGGLHKFLEATTGHFGSMTITVRQEDKMSTITLEVTENANDTIQAALNKINDTLEKDGIEAEAIYETYTNAASGTTGRIMFTSEKYGSRWDMKVSVSVDVKSPGGATSGTATATSTNPWDSNGFIPDTTVLQDSDSTTYTDLDIELGQFTITTRDGVTETITVNNGDTVADLVNNINTILSGAGSSATCEWDQENGRLKFTNTGNGNGVFQIQEVANNTAEDLGLIGSSYDKTYYGKAISRTKDYILTVTDPEDSSNTAVIRASHGTRDSNFAAGTSESYNIVSSGVDPDGAGDETRGLGGITGIGFSLKEKIIKQGDWFIIKASKGSLVLQVGPNEGTEHRIKVNIKDISVKNLGLLDENGKYVISTQEEAMNRIDEGKIDTAIDSVSSTRAALGALQNRLNHTVKNLNITRVNLQAAESRIRDLDMAEGMMEMTRQQILVQSGTAMLAQSNLIPQSVLQLFG